MGIRQPTVREKETKKQALSVAEILRANLLRDQPFIGLLLMRLELKTVVDNRLPTACTDGTTIFFNAEFLINLKSSHQLYLMAHEVWHCLFRHFHRRGNRNRKKFNYAADLEIDFMLREQGFDVLELLSHEEHWIGKPAEEIYELLSENAERPEHADVHIYDGEKADDLGIPGQKDEKSDYVIDPDYVPGVVHGTERKWRQWVIGAEQQIRRNRGTLPAGLERLIEDLYKPQLSWREILERFVTTCFGGTRRWLPPNRRYISSGLYLPSRKDDFLSIVVAIDTSASTMNDLPQFLAELRGIISSFGRYEVTLIECDSRIQSVKKFTEWEPFEANEHNFTGFGGTSFVPVFDHIKEEEEEPRLLIYITDGWGVAPNRPPKYPVLWVLTPEGRLPAEWGEHAWLKLARDNS